MTVTVFGYLILISIHFYDFISPFSSQFRLTRYIKHSRQCLTTFPNTSKFVKYTPLRAAFSTIFSVFGNVVKHGRSCLIYYLPFNFSDFPCLVFSGNNALSKKVHQKSVNKRTIQKSGLITSNLQGRNPPQNEIFYKILITITLSYLYDLDCKRNFLHRAISLASLRRSSPSKTGMLSG